MNNPLYPALKLYHVKDIRLVYFFLCAAKRISIFFGKQLCGNYNILQAHSKILRRIVNPLPYYLYNSNME